jgi:hypothetical protein
VCVCGVNAQVRHAKRAYGADSRSISAVAPFNSMANILYFNLERFANVIVGTPSVSSRLPSFISSTTGFPLVLFQRCR